MIARRLIHILALAAVSASTLAAVAAQGQSFWTGQARVIDADTIDIGDTRFRLHGIDAPESGQSCRHPQRGTWRCGQQAALALSDKIGRAHVTCHQTDQDRYGRVVAVCDLRGDDLNNWLVTSGWAVAYRKYSQDYDGAERQAQQSKRGIWSGDFVPPADWRRGTRLGDETSSAQSKACAIKGNISSNGKRIYHMPGMKWYAKTKISEGKGERWFCSQDEARRAGWVKSRS